jgi:hypothetical protein
MRFIAILATVLAGVALVSARSTFSDGRSEQLWARGCPAACAVNCPDVSGHFERVWRRLTVPPVLLEHQLPRPLLLR